VRDVASEHRGHAPDSLSSRYLCPCGLASVKSRRHERRRRAGQEPWSTENSVSWCTRKQCVSWSISLKKIPLKAKNVQVRKIGTWYRISQVESMSSTNRKRELVQGVVQTELSAWRRRPSPDISQDAIPFHVSVIVVRKSASTLLSAHGSC
jgi:hypothetical protein